MAPVFISRPKLLRALSLRKIESINKLAPRYTMLTAFQKQPNSPLYVTTYSPRTSTGVVFARMRPQFLHGSREFLHECACSFRTVRDGFCMKAPTISARFAIVFARRQLVSHEAWFAFTVAGKSIWSEIRKPDSAHKVFQSNHTSCIKNVMEQVVA